MAHVCVLSADGRWAAAFGDASPGIADASILVWDCRNKCLRLAESAFPRYWARLPVIRPGDNHILRNSGRYSLLIDPATGRVRTIALPPGLSAFSNDGKLLAVANARSFGQSKVELHLLDGRSFRTLKTWQTSEAVTALTLRFSDDNSSLEMTGEGGKPHARRYMGFPVTATVDLKTGKLTETKPSAEEIKKRKFRHPKYPALPRFPEALRADIKAHNSRLKPYKVYGARLSPDASMLIVSGGLFESWDLATGRRVHSGHPGPIKAVLGWTAKGELILKSREGLIRWDPRTGKTQTKNKKADFEWRVAAVRASPDGSYFLASTAKHVYMFAWDKDRALWSRPIQPNLGGWPSRAVWLTIRDWPAEPRKAILIADDTRLRLLEAESGELISDITVTRDNDEKIWQVIDIGNDRLLIGMGDVNRGHIDLYAYEDKRLKHRKLLRDDMRSFPSAIAYGRADSALYFVGVRTNSLHRISAGKESAVLSIRDIFSAGADTLKLDPSGRLLCMCDDNIGAAVDAATLKPPRRVACFSDGLGHWYHLDRRTLPTSNPLPLTDSVAIFVRRALGRIDLVDVRREVTVLSLQTWGKDGWVSYTPDGKWTGDKGGASRIILYEADKPLSAEQVAKLRSPQAIQAALKKLSIPAAKSND
jgi:hypothetical protein